jgi:carbamoylphosphate synthase large subunit
MKIIFYGNHSDDWMSVLNDGLLELIPKEINVEEIINIYDITTLLTYDYKDYFIIPLMEINYCELYINNINTKLQSIESINIFSSKKLFQGYVFYCNLEQYSPKNYFSISKVPKDKYVIIKQNISNNGIGTEIKQNILESDFTEDSIVQEYIENNVEYTAHIVSKNGRIIKSIVYESQFEDNFHIKSFPYNTPDINKVTIDCSILELFLLPLEYTGICNIDFTIDNDNFKVFEINPRFGGSLMRHDKVDLIEILVSLLSL